MRITSTRRKEQDIIKAEHDAWMNRVCSATPVPYSTQPRHSISDDRLVTTSQGWVRSAVEERVSSEEGGLV